MSQIIGSTSIALPAFLAAGAPALLDHWEQLCSGLVDALSIDARNNPRQQKMLLESCRTRGIRCVELTHPLVSAPGRPAAAAASLDPHERRAAVQQLEQTLALGVEHEVRRVVLLPTALALRPDPDQVAQIYAAGAAPAAELEDLREQRRGRAPRLLDGLCLALEPALRRAEELETSLILPWPAPWPHLLPDEDEVAQLVTIFEGAPLGLALCSDWCHVRGALAPELGGAPRAFEAPLISVRLADACGLIAMLPPGTGEIAWPGPLAGLGARLEGLDLVLTVGPGPSRTELQASRELVEELLSWGAAQAARAARAAQADRAT